MPRVTVNSEPEFGERQQVEHSLESPREVKNSSSTVTRLRSLWDRRALLGRVTMVGLIVSTAIAFLIPVRYEATARLMPPDNQSTSGMAMIAALSGRAGGGLGAVAGDLLADGQSTGGLFVGILHSRTVETKVIDQFDLRRVYGERRIEDVLRKLEEHTDIMEDHKSGIIAVTVVDHSPKRAAEMANAYVVGLNSAVAQLSTSSARRERVFLEDRLKGVQRDLEAAEKEFSQFASKSGAIDIKEQGKAMVEGAAMLQGQLIAAESELEGLKELYTDNNIRVRSVQARIGSLQTQLEKLGGKGESTTSAGDSQANSMYPSIRRLPLLGVPYADLYRQLKVQESVYETLTQQYELAKVREAKEIPSVKLLDPASLPEKRSFPPRLIIMFLGTFLTSIAAMIVLLASDRWAEIDPQEPGKQFTQEVLRTVMARLPWEFSNGQPAVTRSFWGRIRRRGSTPTGQAK